MSQAVTVQTQHTPQAVSQRLKSERVEEMLQAIPAWRVLPGGKAIDRALKFPSPRVALAYAEFVAAFATEVGLAVNFNLDKELVVLTLAAPRRRGRPGDLSETVVAFAHQLG
jgi:pterin-4a-carbinolamine dehydratase